MKKTAIILSALTVLVFSGCSTATKFTSVNDSLPAKEEYKDPVDDYNDYNDSESIESVTGIASFYAKKFHGRKTASGEIYDMYNLTAAHESYPFNTIIRVTNLNNNKYTTIRINDRMPPHPQRIIDLSYGTAAELDMLKDGIVNVKLEILEWGDEK